MANTLVLNASYEVLTVVPLHRAVIMLLAEKAELVAAKPGEVLHSPSIEIQAPAVIRIKRFVRVPYRSHAPLTRKTLLARDNHECAYCGGHATTIDHVHPRSRGGRHEWLNVVAACKPCNSRKDDRTLEEAGLTLRFQPKVPHGTTALIVAVGSLDEAWVPYLTPA